MIIYNLGENSTVTIEFFDSTYGLEELYVVRDAISHKVLLSAVAFTEGGSIQYMYVSNIYCVRGQAFTEEFIKYLMDYKRPYIHYFAVEKYLISNQFKEEYGFRDSLYEGEEFYTAIWIERE